MKYFASQSHRSASSKRRTATLRMARLEDRLTPAGFGPEDGAYVVESWEGGYDDVKIQLTDQKIVAAGTSNSSVLISRYDSQGQIDPTFGSGGSSNPPLALGREISTSLMLQSDGKAVLAFNIYSITYPSQHGVARFNSNGTLDSKFGLMGSGWNVVDVRPDDSLSFVKTSVGLQSSGKIVIAGQSYPTSGNPALVARFTAAGKLDSGKSGFGTVTNGKALGYSLSTFGGDINSFSDAVVQPDDKIVAVGASRNVARFLVARYTANGVLDTSFNGSGYGFYLPAVANYVSDIARQPDGKFVVVGRCAGSDGADDLLVARLNSDLTLDTTFAGGTGYVQMDIDGIATQTQENAEDVVIQPDGKIVVSGYALDPAIGLDANSTSFVSRFNADGAIDATFGSGGIKFGAPPAGHYFIPDSLALKSNGDIIVAGSDRDGTNMHPLLMRFFGGASLLTEGGAAHPATDTKPLTQEQVQPLLDETISRWKDTGVDVAALQGVDIRITDLGGSTLGIAAGNTIWLDDDAAGWGWFIDKTPGDDSEFQRRGNQGEQGRMDLLSALMHETGHILGLDHEESGVMQETLATGERHSPTWATRIRNSIVASQSSYLAMLATLPDDDTELMANKLQNCPSALLAVGMP